MSGIANTEVLNAEPVNGADEGAVNPVISATSAPNIYPDLSKLDEMQEHATEAAKMLRSMANENRLMILCRLIQGELSVSELNRQIPLSQSALSQHLAYLREAGLVKTRRESQTIYYRLQGEDAIKVLHVLHSIFCPNL